VTRIESIRMLLTLRVLVHQIWIWNILSTDSLALLQFIFNGNMGSFETLHFTNHRPYKCCQICDTNIKQQ
jgi:hypothetical protein